MKAKTLLRGASVVALLLTIGHTAGYPWVGNVTEQQLSQIIAANSAATEIQGFSRSYWDFHVGFGLTLSLVFFAQAMVLWRLGSLSESEPRSTRFITAVFGAFYLAATAVNFLFFFWAPIVCTALLAVCALSASILLRPGN
ncbi:MAG: hypothetical protein JO006_17440 [Paucibacter sp.]|nr:hypothetical protein [Roseateles sp.]